MNLVQYFNINFCEIPEGSFIRGSNSTSEEEPQSLIELDYYLISQFPITNFQYEIFTKETKYKLPPLLKDERFGHPNQPVVTVSWYDAMNYCEWLSKKIKLSVSLPTEAQWEKAARGTQGITYPWGDAPPHSRLINVNNSVGTTTDVGTYKNASPYGCYDMLGNIWEWCFDWYDANFYKFCPSKNPVNRNGQKLKTIRGGSWRSSLFRATCAHRCYYSPVVRSDRHGFRVVINN